MNDLESYNKLKKLKNYKPSKSVNKVFSELVTFAINSKNTKSLNEVEIKGLQEICSQAESEMEFFWANKIINSKNPNLELKKFWYYDNYLKLANLEWLNLSQCFSKNHEHQNAVFIGSGPLPLTAIFLAQIYNINFLLVDIDKKALNISRVLISKLGLENNFRYSSDNVDNLCLENFEVIFLAALVGPENKEGITQKIFKKMEIGAHLLCRSAYENRVLLYKPLNLNKIPFQPIKEIKTYDEVVNSILIFKKQTA